MRCTALLLTALAGVALAVPAGQRNACADRCEVANTFTYESGQSYVYEYSVTTSTALLGTYDDDAHMHITANAHIDVTTPCEYVLRLTDVSLDGSSHGPEFAAAMTKSPLRFAFQDGHVESLCSEVSEPVWVLNFKRGVLSTFQNSMTFYGIENVEETDISGVCQTHYNSTMEGDIITIDKVKDLASCTHRPDLAAYIPSSGYMSDSPVQSLPLFKSTSKCHQRVEEGVLKMAECEETHMFRPFSSDNGGAMTTAKTTMFLTSKGQPISVPADYEYMKKTMVYDKPEDSSSIQLDEIEKILNDLEVASQNDIRPEVAALFSGLVELLKPLHYPELSTIYNSANGSNKRKYIVDAMPLVGTASAFGVIKDMFNNHDLSESEADTFFTSLAFLKNPTSDMFTAIVPLLDQPSQQALLGTSALVNTYCKLHSDCDKDSSIEQVIHKIETQLGSGCRAVTYENKVKVLVALKALGNVGRFINANSILHTCYTEDNDMEVRVAAIEAWRHTPCEYDQSHLLAAFQDETQDTEIRIAAYLALMTCPNPSLIDTIRDRLTSEGVNQVGSFIWTHMTNMQESAAPGKQWVRQMIGEELLQKKFSTEALKFSRNYESSFFMNELNVGAAIESNVIFSSKSYLPRSAMLNLTLDLFGESINFFEVGGRIEKFESYIERFFGPNGYFPEETTENILRNMRWNSEAEATTLEGFLDEITDEPEGAYYMRIFGNELYYNHFQGIEDMIKSSGASNPMEFLMDLARKGDVDYTKSYQLMNAHMTIPTVSGLPITLSAKGTATLGLKMNGNFKARSLQNVNIEGHFQPSASVHIDGEMLVDAHVTRTGMKLSSNLHTSTFLDGKIQINGGKLVDVAINTPKDKVEIIDVKTEFIYLEDDQEVVKGTDNVVESEDCPATFFGVSLCGALSYNTRNGPLSPFPGPYSAQLYLMKTDTQTGYVFRYTGKKNQLSLEIDTPGSESDHKVSLELKESDNKLSIDIHTPFKSFQGTGEYIWRKANKNIKAAFNMEGEGEYAIDAGLKTAWNGRTKIEPSIIIRTPNGELVNLQASFVKNFGYYESLLSSKIDVDYSFDGTQGSIHQSALYKRELKEDLTNYDDENTYTLQLNIDPSALPDMKIEFDGTSKFSQNKIATTAKLMHGSVTWNAEQTYTYESTNDQKVININAAISCPVYSIDSMVSESLTLSMAQLKTESHLRLLPGKEYAVTAILDKLGYMDVKGVISADLAGFITSLDAAFKKVDTQYTLEISSDVNGENWSIQGSLKDESVPGKISAVLDGHFKSPSHESELQLDIHGDSEMAKAQFIGKIDGQDYTLKVEGTRSSILIDANIIKHIFVKSYVTSTDDIKKVFATVEWDKDVDPTKVFIIDGQFSPEEIHALVKVAETEYSAYGKLIDNGVEMEAKWAADKVVFTNVHYTLGNTKSLAATVQTPFQGWEKQDASFSVTLNELEIDSSFAAVWKNAEQLAFSFSGKLLPGLYTNALNTKVSFTSGFNNFERITFTMDHNMADLTINTNMEGIWGQDRMEGQFQLIPNDNGLDARAFFTSPITQDALVTLHHELVNKELSTTLEAKYGEEVSTATIKGHYDISQTHDVSLLFQVETPVESMPEIDANLKYSLNGDSLNLVTEGRIGEKKVMLNVNGQMTVSEDSTVISGDLRFITPFTHPLTATFKHTHDLHHFTSKFEMARIWSNFGSVKVHAEGHFNSLNDIEFMADFSTPDTKAAISLGHKITENILTSRVQMTINGEQIIISINGDIDGSQRLANLKAEIASTVAELEDVKINLETHKNGDSQVSKIIFFKGENSLTVDHLLTFTDLSNWENSFTVNSEYMLKNKQTHSGTVYAHDLEYVWGSNFVHLIGSVDNKSSGDNRQLDISTTLTTPWIENFKLEVHHEDDGVEYKPTIIIEYMPGQKIELANVFKFENAFFYSESTLNTPFWQTLGYKLNLDFQPRKTATLVLIRGPNRSTIDVNGMWEEAKLDGQLMIDSTYLSNPLSLELAYDFLSVEKKVHIIFTFDKRYELTGTLSGNINEAKASLNVDLPLETVQKVGFTGEYHIESMPFTTNAVFMLNNKKYQVNGKVDTNAFQIDMDIDGQVGSLASNWNYEEDYADIQIKFMSPFTELDNLSFSGMYDFRDQKKVTLTLIRGSQEINVTGKIEGETLILEGTTPFAGWETLKGSFFLSNSAINTYVSRNDRKIEVTGTLHVRTVKGKINLSITTPYAGYETVSVDIKYDLPTEIKTIEFISAFGSEELSLKGELKLTHSEAPEMNLAIVTPFVDFKNLGGEAHWDLKTPVQTAEIKVYRNDRHYNWNLETSAESSLKAYGKLTIASPIEGWTAATVEGNVDFTAMPYQVKFSFDKEGDVKVFEGHFTVEQNNFSGDISTPIAEWEKMTLAGEYTLEVSHMSGKLDLTKGSEKIELEADISNESQKPKVNLQLKTPFAYLANAEFKFEADMSEVENKFHLLFKMNNDTYSMDLTSKKAFKTGYFRLGAASPIPGFSTVDIYAKYDFTGDAKTCELDLKLENDNKHFEAAVQVNDNNFQATVVTPYAGFEVLKFKGDLIFEDTKYLALAGFEKNSEKFDIHFEVDVTNKKIIFKLESPIPTMKHVELEAKYNINGNVIEGRITLQKNDQKFVFDSWVETSPLKTDVKIAVDTPVDGWKSLALDIHYDFLGMKKIVDATVKKDTFIKKMHIEGEFNLKTGSFKVEIPIEGFEVLGAAYTLDLDDDYKKIDTTVKISQNSNEWTFGAYGQYSDSNIVIKFQTPFEDLETIAVEGNINFDQRTGEGVIQFGSNKFTTSVSYSVENMSFILTTPFEILKTLSLVAKYNWSASQKDAMLDITYNDKSYIISSTLEFSARVSELSFQATTPFTGFENLAIKMKYDIDNKDELVLTSVTVGDHEYYFLVSGTVEEKLAVFKSEIKSPFIGWTDAKFEGKIDLTSEDKTIQITLEKDGDVKAIAITGKLIGSTLNFNLKTPFIGFQDIKLFGALDRSKRSIEFMYMQDEAQANLFTSFNSIKLHLKTPFTIAEDITWEISKIDDGEYKFEWKRNENHFTVRIEQLGKKNAYKVDLDAEMQGIFKVTGSVVLNTKGIMEMHIETPLENYKVVDVKLDYKLNKRSAKLEISSSSSNFNVFLNIDKAGIEGKFTVPNPQEDTVVEIHLEPFNAVVKMTSRFSNFRTINYEHQVDFSGDKFLFNQLVKINEEEIVKAHFDANLETGTTKLEFYLNVANTHNSFTVQQDVYNVNILLKQEKNGVEKHLKIDLEASIEELEYLFTKSDITITAESTFIQPTAKLSAHLQIDRTGDRKKVKLEFNPEQSKQYIFDLDYDVDLQNPKKGDFDLHITTPAKRAAPWQHLSGNWDVESEDASVTFIFGQTSYTATGKLSLQDSNLVLTSSNPGVENVVLQWHFEVSGGNADILVKVGRESRYALFELHGNFQNIAEVNFEGAFKAGPLMDSELKFKSEWKNESNKFTSQGSFDYEAKNGKYAITDFHYNPATMSASFEGEFISNIAGLEAIVFYCNYDFDHKIVVHGKMNINNHESEIDFNIAQLLPTESTNTIKFDIPVLGADYGHMEFTFNHDFTQDTAKYIKAVAKIGQRESYVKVGWNHQPEYRYRKFDGSIEFKSEVLGEMHIVMKYDFTQFQEAFGEAKFDATFNGQAHNINVDWRRKLTPGHFELNLVVDTSFNVLNHVRVYANTDYSSDFHLESGLEWNDQKIEFGSELSENRFSAKVITPFENFESIEAEITYSLASQTKKVNLEYKRGQNEVHMDFTFELASIDEATLDLTLTTPFDIIKSLHLVANIANKKAHLEFQRNENKYILDGDVEFHADQSSVDMTFTPPSGKVIKLAASYDVEDFLAGSGSAPQKLASLELDFEGNTIHFNFQGYRNSDKLNVEFEGDSSFELVKNVVLKVDTGLNLSSMDSHIEMRLNDFTFDMKNDIEVENIAHYSFKTRLESTLTTLPALTIGFGRNVEEYSVTVGYGADKEITFSIEGKDNYRSGFSGKVDIPNFGYDGVEYEVEYGFENDNELHMEVEAELGEDGNKIEANFVYNSEGLRARFNSLAGEHSVRVRRSVSEDEFSAEAVLDGYGVKLRGGFSNDDNKYGALLEGEFFGRKFLLDCLYQSEGLEYTEGKLILVTPFLGMEKIGGLFTLANVNNKVMAHTEIHLPIYTLPEIIGEINLDFNDKVKGHVTLDLGGQEFVIKTDLLGSLAEGYTGTVELFTPFHALSYVQVTGDVKISDVATIDSNLKITTPFSKNEVVAKFSLEPGKIAIVFNLKSDKLAEDKHVQFILEGSGIDAMKIEASLNQNHALLELKYISLHNMEGKFALTLYDQTHTVSGKMNIETGHLQTELELESGFFTGSRKLTLDVKVPTPSFKQVSFEGTLTTAETYTLRFDLDVTSGVHAVIKVDTPIFPKTVATLDVSANKVDVTVETPSGTHHANVEWQLTYMFPADYMLNFEVDSPLLLNKYVAGLVIKGDPAHMNLKANLKAGDVLNSFEGDLSITNVGGSLSLTLETPYKDINKATFETSLTFTDKIELYVNSLFFGQTNKLDIVFDKNDRSFLAVAQSPYIPTGQVSAEAKLTGEANNDMEAKMALKTTEKAISGDLKLNIVSLKNMNAELEVLTPFTGYEKLNFNAHFNEDDKIHFQLYANEPIRFKIDCEISVLPEDIKGHLVILTPFQDFETIEANLDIPLMTFGPKVSFNMYVDGAPYGATFGLRTKAPYELAMGYRAAHFASGDFHLRTDSSFITYFKDE